MVPLFASVADGLAWLLTPGAATIAAAPAGFQCAQVTVEPAAAAAATADGVPPFDAVPGFVLADERKARGFNPVTRHTLDAKVRLAWERQPVPADRFSKH